MTSAPSQLQQQLHDELLPLYGRPAADSAVLDCLTRHGFKLPKTLHKSARGDGKIWLTHKKADVELLLATQPYNPLFLPLPAERKGMWMPRLTCAVFSGQHITLPAGLDWGASAEEAGQLLGAPWWSRNGGDHRVWRVPVHVVPHVNTQLTVTLTKAGVRTPWVGIDVNVPVLELGLHGGPLFKLAESPHLYPRLMLMAWQLHQLGHAPESASAADSLAILTQTMHGLGRSYLLREDLAHLAQFDWGYGLMSAVMAHSLRDDYQCIVGGDELPTDATGRAAPHLRPTPDGVRGIGLERFNPHPGLSGACHSAWPASGAIWRPTRFKSETPKLQRFADNAHSAVALGDRQAFTNWIPSHV